MYTPFLQMRRSGFFRYYLVRWVKTLKKTSLLSKPQYANGGILFLLKHVRALMSQIFSHCIREPIYFKGMITTQLQADLSNHCPSIFWYASVFAWASRNASSLP